VLLGLLPVRQIHPPESATGAAFPVAGTSSELAPKSCGRKTVKKIFGIFVVAVGLLLPLLSVAQNQRSNEDQRHDQGYGTSHGRWEGRLSTEDQGRFDSYYSRWLEYGRTNNRDEIVSMENRMRDVMSHYNIPSDVPFGQIASNNNQGYGAYRRGDKEK
jgi:hypothetical protein